MVVAEEDGGGIKEHQDEALNRIIMFASSSYSLFLLLVFFCFSEVNFIGLYHFQFCVY